MGEGCLILALRLRLLLDISAAALLLEADLRFVRFGSHRRGALSRAISRFILRQCLLGIGGYLQFDAPPLRFLGRTEIFAKRRGAAPGL